MGSFMLGSSIWNLLCTGGGISRVIKQKSNNENEKLKSEGPKGSGAQIGRIITSNEEQFQVFSLSQE